MIFLRWILGITLIIHSVINIERLSDLTIWRGTISVISFIIGALLFVGGLTSIASFIALVVNLVSVIPFLLKSESITFQTGLLIAYILITTIACFLLGPGVYSVDARMFGRREIIIPGKTNPPDL